METVHYGSISVPPSNDIFPVFRCPRSLVGVVFVNSGTDGSYENGACVKEYLVKLLRILVHRMHIKRSAAR